MVEVDCVGDHDQKSDEIGSEFAGVHVQSKLDMSMKIITIING